MPPRLPRPSALPPLPRSWQSLSLSPGPRIRTPAATAYRLLSSQSRPQTVAEFLRIEKGQGLDNAVVYGYVRSVRKLKTERFLNIGDGSSVKHLQAIVPRSLGNEFRVGTAVRLRGSWAPSENRDSYQSHELKVSEVEVLGASDPQTYPLQNKYQTLEFLRTLPHLRSRIPLNSALLRLRSDAVTILNNFFSSKGFTQTHPPIITSSDCEGAGEVFTLVAGKPEPKKENDGSDKKPLKAPEPFFRSPKYLTVSTQLHLEALAQSVGNVWTLSPTFRAEKSDTSRHMAEFYMLEAEMTFVEDMETVMDLAEDMIRHLVASLSDNSAAAKDILAAAKRVTGEAESLIGPAEELETRWKGLSASAPRWPRITYSDAISLLQTAPASQFEHTPTWGASLQAEHERWLATAVAETRNPGYRTPVFVTHYPRDIKAFYMLGSDSADAAPEATGPTVDCFDLIVPELCEIAGGSMREHRLEPLLDAMRRGGMEPPAAAPGRGRDGRSKDGLDWYVDLRRWGSPPHGGFGIGFDRLLAYLVGAQSVKDVVAFPRWWGRCDS
ncbi:related to asn-tRNA synthetase, mitochondrial [Cephalotrichum gorgonifer]|uniref:asparagine--tRNA ligase n=1 Tax=Cephalotrichum gorgonifer TaxID=2041049 RepID=A0AAE8N7C1_9PEZI|nr:related to asn-tRNA synthetase, mitochondrial [Cephalotrichum gorgonifer]